MTPDTAKLVDIHRKGIERFIQGLPDKERGEAVEALLTTIEGVTRALNVYIGKPIMQKQLPLDSSGDPDPTQKPAPAIAIPKPPL